MTRRTAAPAVNGLLLAAAAGLVVGGAAVAMSRQRRPPWIPLPGVPAPDTNTLVRRFIMYFIVPLWHAAGLADWLCHRRTAIEKTTGLKESLIHLLMLGEMGVPVLACL